MGFRSSSPPVCSLNRNCSEWARIYLKYCLCSVKDGVALSLGMISVISWGVAEVPQIITNCKEKSTEGLSIAFLMTWIVGDLFNLIGCLLEPATLPTQFYMALLYTATTVILTGQTIYYGCIYPQLKAKKISHHRTVRLHEDQRIHQDERIGKQKVPGSKNDEKECKATNYQESGSTPPNECFPLQSSPIPVATTTIQRYDSGGKDLYYISARSLSKSPVPTAGSWLAYSRSPGRTTPFRVNDQHPAREPLLGRHVSAESAPTSNIKNMLCVVFPAAFFLVCFKPHLSIDNRLNVSPHGMVIKLGRRLLKDRAVESSMREAGGSSSIGTILGWAMAAIYMGGRLPQICLNIRRGNVEGLNPLMFIFALIGNTTYVGSILVNSLEWSKIKPNLPWLVDAGGCVLLDLFILCQFVYFHYWKPKNDESRQDC